MPHVTINGSSPKEKISPIKKRSWDDDIMNVEGVTSVSSEVSDEVIYKATVTGGTAANISAALASVAREGWMISVS